MAYFGLITGVRLRVSRGVDGFCEVGRRFFGAMAEHPGA